MKKLYRVTSCLLGRTKDNPFPPHNDEVLLANKFLQFFVDKITKMRNDLDNISIESTHDEPQTSNVHITSGTLSEFKLLSEDDIIKLIQGSKSTTCELDIIPTLRLKDNLQYVIPILTEIINRSLSSGVFPKDWKML